MYRINWLRQVREIVGDRLIFWLRMRAFRVQFPSSKQRSRASTALMRSTCALLTFFGAAAATHHVPKTAASPWSHRLRRTRRSPNLSAYASDQRAPLRPWSSTFALALGQAWSSCQCGVGHGCELRRAGRTKLSPCQLSKSAIGTDRDERGARPSSFASATVREETRRHVWIGHRIEAARRVRPCAERSISRIASRPYVVFALLTTSQHEVDCRRFISSREVLCV